MANNLSARIAALREPDEREAQKACSRCKQLRALSGYWRDHRTSDGRQSACILCLKKTPGKNRQRWNRKEHLIFVRMAGRYSPKQIGKAVGRSKGAVTAYAQKQRWSLRLGLHLSTGDLLRLCRISKDILEDWRAAGLITLQAKPLRVSVTGLRHFWKRHPEAFDVYSLPEEALEAFKIDFEKWPEPPCFKILKCSGFVSKYKGWRVSHPTVEFLKPLYQSQVACPVCAHNVSKYGVGYTDEWEDPYFPRKMK